MHTHQAAKTVNKLTIRRGESINFSQLVD